jgi:vesicle-associated membrane protein 7
MSLLYALVARDQNILCEYTEAGGNFPTVTRAVLKHITSTSTTSNSSGIQEEKQEDHLRSVFPYHDHNFFFLKHDHSILFMCMAEEKVHANVAFKMLEEMKDQFFLKYGPEKPKVAIAYAMSNFQNEMKLLLKKYDHFQMDTPLTKVRQRMEKVKMIMIENVNQLMERGEKIDLLVVRTEQLQQDAFKYEKTATKLKKHFYWKNISYMVCLILLILVLVYVSLMFLCGFDLSTCDQRMEQKAKNVFHNVEDFGKKQFNKMGVWKNQTQAKIIDVKETVTNKAQEQTKQIAGTFQATNMNNTSNKNQNNNNTTL